MKAPASLADLPRPLYFFDGYCVHPALVARRDPLAAALLLVPAVIRDPIYDLIARNHYRWFGRRPSRFGPTPEMRGRFIDR